MDVLSFPEMFYTKHVLWRFSGLPSALKRNYCARFLTAVRNLSYRDSNGQKIGGKNVFLIVPLGQKTHFLAFLGIFFTFFTNSRIHLKGFSSLMGCELTKNYIFSKYLSMATPRSEFSKCYKSLKWPK